MKDLRGVQERLRAGAEAEQMVRVAQEKLRISYTTLQLARIGASDYRESCEKKLNPDIGYAGDPLPNCTAIDELIGIYEKACLKDSIIN